MPPGGPISSRQLLPVEMVGFPPSENDHTSTSGKDRQLKYHHWVRLLRIIALLQLRYFQAPETLCKELEVSRRTLQRDIALLRTHGVKISGAPGRYGLIGPRW